MMKNGLLYRNSLEIVNSWFVSAMKQQLSLTFPICCKSEAQNRTELYKRYQTGEPRK